MLSNRKLIASLITALALAAPSSALAQGPITDAYGGDGGEVLPEVVSGGGGGDVDERAGGDGTTPVQAEAGGGAPTTTTASGGSLPFTGLDVGLLAAGGLAMLGIGLSLRRIGRSAS